MLRYMYCALIEGCPQVFPFSIHTFRDVDRHFNEHNNGSRSIRYHGAFDQM